MMSSIVALVFTALLGVVAPALATDYHLPDYVSNSANTSVPVTTQLGFAAFDGTYIPISNASTYEWWYFDAVASDAGQHVVFQPIIGQNRLLLSGSFSNGTAWHVEVANISLYTSTDKDGSTGVSSAGDFSWQSKPDMSEYDIVLDLPDEGVTGTVHLQTIAPAHAPSTGNSPGADTTIRWNLLWANAVPDSVASVNLKVNGTAVAFTGTGYHDKNWGPEIFAIGLDQWYWGHGRSGDYSIVWFYVIETSGTAVASGYIAKNNEILFVGQFRDDTVKVRAYGGNVPYPVPSTWDPSLLEGVRIDIDAGPVGIFNFTTKKTYQVTRDPTYDRWIGTFSGGIAGGKVEEGIALWEQMRGQ